jgi:hypothetical protein
MMLSRHPEPSPVLHHIGRCNPTRAVTSLDALVDVHHADNRPALDPRSLDPAALFGARMPSVFEAGRRLPTSATTFRYDVRATQPGLLILAGRRPQPPSFSYAPRWASLAGAVTHGEPRNAHSLQARCWFLPVARVCPTAISFRMRHLQRPSPVEYSDDRRTRVSGPNEGRHQPERKWLVALASGACAWMRACRCVPLFGHQRTPFVPGASVGGGGPTTDCRRPA